MENKLKIKIVSKGGQMPEYATAGSAGADLRAYLEEPVTLMPGERRLVPTGLFVELPPGFEAQIRARSGLAIKHGIGLLNSVGVIDSDYRGEICVGVINQLKEAYTINPDERIAQLVIMLVSLITPVEADELDDTERGAGGFGSTGKA